MRRVGVGSGRCPWPWPLTEAVAVVRDRGRDRGVQAASPDLPEGQRSVPKAAAGCVPTPDARYPRPWPLTEAVAVERRRPRLLVTRAAGLALTVWRGRDA